ncbi:MAG: hypothetical protein SFX72_00620 [Isosphaeraceae bacterium]|nr:hypothetical protein [Isosphaeraceae bacterium]
MSRRPSSNRRRRPRPPGIFRAGERKRPDVLEERTRLTLYITNRRLDQAAELFVSSGFSTLQRYCEALLEEAILADRSRARLELAETEHGPLEGLREIADDPEYLAEWNASTAAARSAADGDEIIVDVVDRRAEGSGAGVPVIVPRTTDVFASNSPQSVALEAASASVLAHVWGTDAERALLAALRRGEPPRADAIADLVDALGTLDAELSTRSMIDRRLAHALHRLAFESQVLLTDAFPGAFDAETVHTLRAVQEAVDRILSGEDIRYVEG